MKHKKKIAIIGTAGVPAQYGGFETLAHNLVLQLNETYDIHVYASTKTYAKAERKEKWQNATIHYVPFGANGASSIIYDIVSMIHAIFFADYLIVLGVSGGIFIPFIKLFSKAKIIVNIDGMEWRRNKWNKWIKRFLKFSEKIAVRYSDADITDNIAIKRYTAIFYKTASHLIAYGADHVSPQKLSKADYKEYTFLSRPYAFKVARIEPENNVELILSTFSKFKCESIVIVGNWENSEYGKRLKNTYSKFQNIHLLDPIYDQVKLDKLRSNCFIYIHGHSAGGTNPSLVEAMYLGLPIVAFDVSYNRATMQNEGLYFGSEKQLMQILKDTYYTEFIKIGNKLMKIAKYQYTWSNISKRYASIIELFDYAYTKPKLTKYSSINYTNLLESGYAHLSHTKLFFESTPKTEHYGK